MKWEEEHARKIIDISPPLCPASAVFPGDTPFSRKVELDFKRGDNLLLSSIQLSLHLGAHADAPNHYHASGVSIEERALQRYLGRCQVIHVPTPVPRRLVPGDIEKISLKAPRILFRTDSFPDQFQWRDSFSSLSPELVSYLAEANVFLVGLDTPSIDPADSKLLESHQEVFQRDMSILEGVVLDQVTPGLYTLVALPLRIVGADASPVRAVLLPD